MVRTGCNQHLLQQGKEPVQTQLKSSQQRQEKDIEGCWWWWLGGLVVGCATRPPGLVHGVGPLPSCRKGGGGRGRGTLLTAFQSFGHRCLKATFWVVFYISKVREKICDSQLPKVTALRRASGAYPQALAGTKSQF